jgi:ligand-binding sensor domain-containing protein
MSTDHNGTYFYDGKSFTQLTSIAGIVNESNLTLSNLSGMTEDKAGNLWFASWPPTGEGLSRYDGKTITRFTDKQGINDDLFHCVIEDKSGIVWAGSRNHGVFRYDARLQDGQGNSFAHISDKNGPRNDCIYSILEDRSGDIWFATERNGVYRYDGKSLTNYTTLDGLSNNSVFSIVEDKAGNLWFGTRNVGLCRYDGKSFISFSE